MGPVVYVIWEGCFLKNQSTKYLYNHKTNDYVIMLIWSILAFQRWPVHIRGSTSSLASWLVCLWLVYSIVSDVLFGFLPLICVILHLIPHFDLLDFLGLSIVFVISWNRSWAVWLWLQTISVELVSVHVLEHRSCPFVFSLTRYQKVTFWKGND